MRICIIRHGQTDWNLERRWQGHTDNPLNRTGLKQAAAAGQALTGLRWDLAFCSPLTRARQTAEAACAACGLEPPTPIPGFIERDFGRFEGLYIPDNPLDETDPTLETVPQTMDRMEAALLQLVGDHLGKNLLIASHGRASRALLERLFGMEAVGHLQNCSMSLFEYRNGGFHPILINKEPEEFAALAKDL